MDNINSYDQIPEWKNFEETLNRCNKKNNLINNYYECLIDNDSVFDHKLNCKNKINLNI